MQKRIDEEVQQKAIELYRQVWSLRKVAGELGVSDESVRKILIRNNLQRRCIGRPEKYPKTDFSGNPAEQARLWGFINDCDASVHHKQIRVQTSTTHPAQILLSNDLFGRYGHISRTPSYNQQFSLYQWQLQILLNVSFRFLAECRENQTKFLAEIAQNGHEYEYIGGLAEAESWIGIDANKGRPRANLRIFNKNRSLLEWTQVKIGGRIYLSGNVYQLQLSDEEAVEALRKIPIMHEEKAAAKELILHHAHNGGIGLEALMEYRELRRKIDNEVRLCTLRPRLEYIGRHGKPHPADPDQAIPQN